MSYVDALCRCGSILNLKPNTFEYIPSFKQTGNEKLYDRKRKPALKYQVGDYVVIVYSYYRGETRSLEYASTGVVNSRYD